MTFNPYIDLRPGDRVHDTVLEKDGTFTRYYNDEDFKLYAVVVFDGDERPMRIHPEDLILVEER